MQEIERIGIVCAMQDEVDAFLAMAHRHHTDAAGCHRLAFGDIEAVIAQPGLGKVHAAMTGALLVERFGCRALVSAGTAGGLRGARPMNVVVGAELIQHDYGRSRAAGEFELYPPGIPPLPEFFSDDVAFRLPAKLYASLRGPAAELDYVQFGTFASGDTFVNDDSTRARLTALGAIAVDMESAAVAQVAEALSVPWLVAKGISDNASGISHEAFLEGLAEASRRSAMVVQTLLPAMRQHLPDAA